MSLKNGNAVILNVNLLLEREEIDKTKFVEKTK